MIARFAGGTLGLLAFSVSTLAGLVAGNPAQVILIRALKALVIFCVLGLAIGATAQAVINEYMARKSKELLPDEGASGGSAGEQSAGQVAPAAAE
jgi:hypothetical protein